MRTLAFALALTAAGAIPAVAQQTTLQSCDPSHEASATDPGATPVYRLDEVDQAPRVANARAAQAAVVRHYPRRLSLVRTEQVVNVCFIVEADGRLSSPWVTRSTDERFEQASIEVVSGMRFRPARVDGRAVRVWVEHPVVWAVTPRVRVHDPRLAHLQDVRRREEERRSMMAERERDRLFRGADVRASFSEEPPCGDPTRFC